jgi:hypothetical protein
VYETNASNPDTDGDEFNDFNETNIVGLNPTSPDTALRDFFIETENRVRAEGNESGILFVQQNLSTYNLYTEAEKNASDAIQYASGKAVGMTEGNASGILYVQSNPSKFVLYTEEEKNASDAIQYASGKAVGMTEGNASGILYVQSNPSKFDFLTEAERNASYDKGLSDGNASGKEWVQNNLSTYNLYTAEELEDAVATAKAEALAEVQADLATQGLSSLTYLEQVTGQAIPHTDGWYYHPGQGWLWTNRETFPFIFRQGDDQNSGGWLYFSQLPDHTDKPLWDYELGDWISISGN